MALLASIVMTAVYHAGFSDFRSSKLRKPALGDTIWSVSTLVTLNPVRAPIAHVGVHVSAVLHSYDTRLPAAALTFREATRTEPESRNRGSLEGWRLRPPGPNTTNGRIRTKTTSTTRTRAITHTGSLIVQSHVPGTECGRF